MFAALASAIYGFFEKRIKSKLLVTLCYFLAMGMIWAVITFCIAWMVTARDIARNRIDPSFLHLIPLAGFLLGDIFAFFPWILGLRNSGEEK